MLDLLGEELGWTDHEQWRNDPVYYEGEADLDPYLSRPERMVQRLILDFAEDGVHHYQ